MLFPSSTMEDDESGYWIAVAGLLVVELVQTRRKHLSIHIITGHQVNDHLIGFNIKTLCFTKYSHDIFNFENPLLSSSGTYYPGNLCSWWLLITVEDSFVFYQVGFRVS